jgi:GPI mannosyltransferase 3
MTETGPAAKHEADVRRLLLTRWERRTYAIALGLVFLTAWFSTGSFHPDENAQVVGFAGYKLGALKADAMPWEWHARIRPFLQPALYTFLLKPLVWLGVKNPFTWAWLMRLATGLFSWLSWMHLTRTSLRSYLVEANDEGLGLWRAKAHLWTLPLFGFLPYLMVRTSSETAASAACALAYASAAGGSHETKEKLSKRAALASGVWLALAFEFRFQCAALGIGLVLWLALIRKVGARLLAYVGLGALSVLGLARLIDFWSYGEWVLPPWRYFNENLLQGKASTFGTSPFYGYLYLMPANLFLPTVVLLLLALGRLCIKKPLHPLVFCIVPFVLLHSAIAHKEERFLFPLALLATLLPSAAYGAAVATESKNDAPPKRPLLLGGIQWPLILLSMLPCAVLAVFPVGLRSHPRYTKFVYDNFPSGLQAVSTGDGPILPEPIFRRTPYEITPLSEQTILARIEAGQDVILFTTKPVCPLFLTLNSHSVQCTRIYSEWPAADASWGESAFTKLQLAWPRATWVPTLRFGTLYRLQKATADVAPKQSLERAEPGATDAGPTPAGSNR